MKKIVSLPEYIHTFDMTKFGKVFTSREAIRTRKNVYYDAKKDLLRVGVQLKSFNVNQKSQFWIL